MGHLAHLQTWHFFFFLPFPTYREPQLLEHATPPPPLPTLHLGGLPYRLVEDLEQQVLRRKSLIKGGKFAQIQSPKGPEVKMGQSRLQQPSFHAI